MEEKSLIISQENLIAEAGEFVKGLTLPTNYDYNSATKSFYLQLIETKDMNKKPALEVCTKPSIVNALQTMLNYGLSTEKKQCALIVRGDKLCCHIEYFGWVKLAKTYAGVRITSACIRKGEKVTMSRREDGALIIKHKPKWECQNNPIVGAYAIATDIKTGLVVNSDIMTMEEIQRSWLQSSNRGLETHKKFPHEMARKTVEARLAKHLVNKTDDGGKLENYDDYVVVNTDDEIDANISVDEDDMVVTNPDGEVVAEPISGMDDLANFGEPEVDSDGWFEVYYSEYKDNKDKYYAGEYNKFTKKIKVKLKEQPVAESEAGE